MRKLEMDELHRKTHAEFRDAEKFPLILVLDNVRSMMNIGSIFRTADAFMLESILLCGITATPPHREIQKTALGATETVNWKYFERTTDAVAWLKEQGYTIYALEQVVGSIDLRSFAPQKDAKYAVVLGNEVNGVDTGVLQLCDGCVEIPQFGTKHSLNVAVATGMVVWDFYSKRL
ncbi:MAG TPA: RNA methyltransferase [Bacteroidales bacterium]|nr:RNA methyltransferase [Bacteroidales bacterium]